MRKGGSRNAAVINLAGVTKDVVDSDRTLCSGRMSEHQLAGDVSNSPEIGLRNTIHQDTHVVVHRNKAPIGLHSHRLKIEMLAAGHSACGHKHRIHFQGLNWLSGFHINQLNLHR